MKGRFCRCALVFVFLVCSASAGLAQEAPTVYTSVALWDVPRAKWGDFVAHMEKDAPTLEKLVADGVIVEWGIDSEALHSPEGYTHSLWMSAHSMADLEKAGDSLSAYSPDARAALDAMVTKHMDLYFRSAFYASRPARLTSGFAMGSFVRVKRGEGSDYRRAWEEWSKPVFDQLLADGTIVSYTLDSPYMHTSEESLGLMATWYVVEKMEDDQKVEAAFDAARAKLSATERDARQNRYWSMVIENSHRDDFTRLIHYQTK